VLSSCYFKQLVVSRPLLLCLALHPQLWVNSQIPLGYTFHFPCGGSDLCVPVSVPVPQL
jgi:hypothetical protein